MLPFGYPTEQFIRQVKQDIQEKIEEQRMQWRNSGGMQQEDGEGKELVEKDTGLITHESGMFIEIPVNPWGSTFGVTISVRLTDTLYNNYRR